MLKLILFAACLAALYGYLVHQGASQAAVVLTIGAGFIGLLIATLALDA